MADQDWNAGRPGLPFFLSGATEVHCTTAADVGSLAPVATRRHRVLQELVQAYALDGHEPEVWHGRQLISTGEGMARVNFQLVRCRLCDQRTNVSRIRVFRARYRGGHCVPVSLEEFLDEHERRKRRSLVVGLRLSGGVALFFGAMIAVTMIDRGRSWEVAAAAGAMAVAGLSLLVGARQYRRPPEPDRPMRSWLRTGWGRVALLSGVVFIVAVVLAPKDGGAPTLVVGSAAESSPPSARRCAILARGSIVQAFGLSVSSNDLGHPDGNGPGGFVGEGPARSYACGAVVSGAVAQVTLRCVPRRLELRSSFDPGLNSVTVQPRTPDVPGDAQALTWSDHVRQTRGAAVAREGLLADLTVGRSGFVPVTDAEQDRAAAQLIAVLDYAAGAGHIRCDAG